MFQGAALKVTMGGRDGGGAEPVRLPHGEGILWFFKVKCSYTSFLYSDGIVIGKNDFPSHLGGDSQPFPFVGTFTLTRNRVEVSEGFVYFRRNVDFFAV